MNRVLCPLLPQTCGVSSPYPIAYLALGISGAPEHVEGMTDSDVVIAVNTDPTAPIFDVAHYGAEMDLIDLLPVLTEQVIAAKGD